METPDITPVQIRAVLLWVFSFLALVGVNVGTTTSNTITGLALGFSTALPVILVYADAAIRKARANNLAGILDSRTPERQPLAAPYFGQGE